MTMTVTAKNWLLGVSGTVGGSILCFALVLWWGHFEVSAQTMAMASATKDNQAKLTEIVDRLTKIHEAKDAGLDKVAELCRAGKLVNCEDCAEAGVELKKCVD